jgi:acyl carrier protein
MDPQPRLEAVRERVENLITRECGRVEENLLESGLIDSLKAIGVALTLEQEFQIPLTDLSVVDMKTVSSLTAKVHSIAHREGVAA